MKRLQEKVFCFILFTIAGRYGRKEKKSVVLTQTSAYRAYLADNAAEELVYVRWFSREGPPVRNDVRCFGAEVSALFLENGNAV